MSVVAFGRRQYGAHVACSYCHRRKVCPAPLHLLVLSACDWILCSKEKNETNLPFQNPSHINVLVHICNVCIRLSLDFFIFCLQSWCANTLSLWLCSCSSSLGCRFQSRRRREIHRRSPPPLGPSAEHKAGRLCTHSF